MSCCHNSNKNLRDLQDSYQVGTHKEARPQRIKKDESDVQKLMECFTTGLMKDPFSVEEDGSKIPLINFAQELLCLKNQH